VVVEEWLRPRLMGKPPNELGWLHNDNRSRVWAKTHRYLVGTVTPVTTPPMASNVESPYSQPTPQHYTRFGSDPASCQPLAIQIGGTLSTDGHCVIAYSNSEGALPVCCVVEISLKLFKTLTTA